MKFLKYLFSLFLLLFSTMIDLLLVIYTFFLVLPNGDGSQNFFIDDAILFFLFFTTPVTAFVFGTNYFVFRKLFNSKKLHMIFNIIYGIIFIIALGLLITITVSKYIVSANSAI